MSPSPPTTSHRLADHPQGVRWFSVTQKGAFDFLSPTKGAFGSLRHQQGVFVFLKAPRVRWVFIAYGAFGLDSTVRVRSGCSQTHMGAFGSLVNKNRIPGVDSFKRGAGEICNSLWYNREDNWTCPSCGNVNTSLFRHLAI
nr:hypothetical protein [Tanacetum cinerariifolium]